MRQYSIDTVELSWLGLDLKEGLAVGTAITEARNAPAFSIKPTASGKVVRVYNPDRSGTLSVIIDQESETQQNLTSIAKADALPGTRTQVGPMVLKDAASGEEITFENAFIMQEPDMTRGTESATFTWTFGFENVTKTVPQTLQNLVGG